MLLFVNACVYLCVCLCWERERDNSLLWNYLALQAWNDFDFGHFQFSVSHFSFSFCLFWFFSCLFVYTRSFCLFVCEHEPQTCLPCAQWASACIHTCALLACVSLYVGFECVCMCLCVCVLRALLSFRSVSFASSKLYSTLSFAWAASAAVAVAVVVAAAALRRCPLPPSVTFSFSSHRQLQKATTKSCRCNLALHCCCQSAQLWLCLCLSRCLCRSLSLSKRVRLLRSQRTKSERCSVMLRSSGAANTKKIRDRR